MSKTVGERIRELRKEKNLTQKAFAKILGYAQTTVANWENQSHRTPDRRILGQIAEIFNTTTDYLLGVEKFDGETIPFYGEFTTQGFKWSKNRFNKISHSNYFSLKIKDKDLEPFALENDYGIFKKSCILPKDKDIVIVRFPEMNDLTMVKIYRFSNNILALLPINPYSTSEALLFSILSNDKNKIEVSPKNTLIVEGIMIGIKRQWEKIIKK